MALTKKQKTTVIGKRACAKCGTTQDLTVDHIVPTTLVTCFGYATADEPWNLQVLCKLCNTSKANLLDPTNPKTLKNLNRYIKKWQNLHRVQQPYTYIYRNLPVSCTDTPTYWSATGRATTYELKQIYKKQKRMV